jgi:hypothetical protein
MAGALAIALGAATASAGTLINPGFDNPVPVGILPGTGFGQVVGPPFSPGFWGAENSSIVSTGGSNGLVTPRSLPQMLEMRDDGLTVTQAWQAVNVVGMLPPNPRVGLGAWFTVSANSFGAVAGVQMRTFGPGATWPNWSGIWGLTGQLDGASHTWQPISLAPVSIPANTEWILAEVYYGDASLVQRGTHGYVDDVQLTIVPEPATGLLLVSGCFGLAFALRRRVRD